MTRRALVRSAALLAAVLCCVAPDESSASWASIIARALENSAAHQAAGGTERAAAGALGRESVEAAMAARASRGVRDDFTQEIDDATNAAQRREWDDTLSRFASRPGADPNIDLQGIAAATAAIGRDQETGRTIAYSTELPNIRIKAPSQTTAFDEGLRAFARARLDATLTQRFDVDDLHVVTLAMADSPLVSAKEIARYRSVLGPGLYDGVGPLSRIEAIDETPEAIARALAPYRHTTVVLVGHIPEDGGAFFVHTAHGRKAVSIADWSDAARQAEVNLIPIGCNSGRFAEFGVQGLVNSTSVLQRLRQIQVWRPRTIGTFFSQLVGDDLMLTISATDAQLFAKSATVTTRDGRVVGEIPIGGIQSLPELTRMPQATRAPGYPGCFLEADAARFDACATRATAAADEEARLAREREAAEARDARLSALPSLLAQAGDDVDEAVQSLVTAGAVYVLAWLLCTFLVPFGILVYAMQQANPGLSFAQCFTPSRVRNSLRDTLQESIGIFGTLFTGLRLLFTEKSSRGSGELWRVLLYLPCAIGLPALFFLTNDTWSFWLGVVAVVIALVMLGLVNVSITERVLAPGLSAMAFFVWVGCGFAYHERYGDLVEARGRVEVLAEEHASLRVALLQTNGK